MIENALSAQPSVSNRDVPWYVATIGPTAAIT